MTDSPLLFGEGVREKARPIESGRSKNDDIILSESSKDHSRLPPSSR